MSPGLSDTGLLVIRIVMTVVLGIGVLYGFLIMTTFQRYGMVMDKEWKGRIDKWIEEAARNTGHPDLNDGHPPPHLHPDQSARYQRPTPSRHQPSSPAYPQPNIVPSPPGSPHSAPSNDASTINRPKILPL
jgi:hypothetical protein